MAAPRAVAGVAAAGFAAGLALIPIGLSADGVEPAGIWAVLGPLVGWSFIGAGLYALARPPSHRFGALMVLTGFLWFLGALSLLDEPLLWALGLPLGSLWAGTLAHALLAFPTGRLASRTARAVVAGFHLASAPHAGQWDGGCALASPRGPPPTPPFRNAPMIRPRPLIIQASPMPCVRIAVG